ncbi:MAG: hypothetical protein ACRD5H_00055 [Nitrososphaerales archaeon]
MDYEFQDNVKAGLTEKERLMIYGRLFSFPVSIIDLSDDLEIQKKGIDTRVDLADASSLYVEEKVCRDYYPTLIVEFMSNAERGHPGWIIYSQANYLLYCIRNGGAVQRGRSGHAIKYYFISMSYLQSLWEFFGWTWKEQFGICQTTTEGLYTTRWTPIPVQRLRSHFASSWKEGIISFPS